MCCFLPCERSYDGGGLEGLLSAYPVWGDRLLNECDCWVMVWDDMFDAVLVGPGGGLGGITLDIRRPVGATTNRGLAPESSWSEC